MLYKIYKKRQNCYSSDLVNWKSHRLFDSTIILSIIQILLYFLLTSNKQWISEYLFPMLWPIRRAVYFFLMMAFLSSWHFTQCFRHRLFSMSLYSCPQLTEGGYGQQSNGPQRCPGSNPWDLWICYFIL